VLQDHQVRVHARRDAPAAIRVSEPARGGGGQGCQDLLKRHFGARHERELQRGIEVVGIADVGAEQDLASGLRKDAQLAGHFVEPLFAILNGLAAFARFEIEQCESRDQSHVRPFEAGDERGSPGRRAGRGVGQDVHAAGDHGLQAGAILRMSENRQVSAMSFVYRRAHHLQRHIGDLASALHGSGKELDPVGAALGLGAHAWDSVVRRSHRRHGEVVGLEEAADVHRRLRPEGLSDGQNVWAADFAALDSVAHRERVIEHRRDVEDGGEAPAVEHRVQGLVQFRCAGILRVEQAGTPGRHVHASVCQRKPEWGRLANHRGSSERD
jgi:hypothetical protein